MRTLFIAVYLTILALFVTSIVAEGRCVPLEAWGQGTNQVNALHGFIQPVCFDALQSAGITHYWIESENVPDGDVNGECSASAQYVLDRAAFQFTHLFTDNSDILNGVRPKQLCQQIIILFTCILRFPACNEGDTTESRQLQPLRKPCRWICELLAKNEFHSDDDVGHDGVLCDVEDRAHLAKYGLDFSFYSHHCDTDIYSDDEGCVAPLSLPQRTMAPKCEIYTGRACSAVFGDNYSIYLPPGVSQETLEAGLDFESTFLSLPRDDLACASAWTRLFCQNVFQECLSYGLREYDYIDGQPDTEGKRGEQSYHSIPLRASTDACWEFHNVCPQTPLFQHPLISSQYSTQDCNLTHDVRKNDCFPANPLPIEEGEVDPPPTPVPEDGGFETASLTNEDEDMLMNVLVAVSALSDDFDEHNDDVVPPAQRFTPEELFDLFSNSTASRFFQTANYHAIQQTNDDEEDEGNQSTQKRFTPAQIELINQMNQVYNFNAKSYLDHYETAPIVYVGPQPWDPTATTRVLYGHIHSATYPRVEPQSLVVPTACPSPLVMPDNTSEPRLFDGYCQIPCPSPRWTSTDRKRIEIISLVFICLALLFSLMLSLTYLIFRSQRHKRNLFFYTLTYFASVLMVFIGLMNRSGSRSTYFSQCDTNTHLSHMKGFGLFQGMLLIYFCISSAVWWNLQAVELFEKLILGRTYRRGTAEYNRRRLAFHLFAWVLPAFCVAALLCGGQIGYDGFLPFAFMGQDNSVSSRAITLSWAFFFAPLLALALIGFGLVGTIFFFLIRYDPTGGLKKYNDEMESKTSSTWFKIGQSIKLFGFVAMLIPFIIITLIHQLYAGPNEAKWADADRQWGESILIVGLQAAGPPPTGMETSRVILTTVGFATPGMVMFLLYFVFSSDVFGLWCGLAYNYLNMTFLKTWVKEDTITGSDSGGSSTHSSGSGGSTDLFSGNIGLTGKSRKVVESQASNGPNSVTLESDGGGSSAVNTQGSSTTGGDSTTTSATSPKTADKIRRTTLFKGFSKPESGSSRRSKGTRDRDLGYELGIEMPNLIEAAEDKDE